MSNMQERKVNRNRDVKPFLVVVAFIVTLCFVAGVIDDRDDARNDQQFMNRTTTTTVVPLHWELVPE